MMVLFQVCFFVGIGLAILSLVLGGLTDFLGIDGVDGMDLDLEIDGLGIDISLPLNPVIYIVLITVFGGVGMILTMTTTFTGMVIIAISIAAGIGAGALLYRLVILPLKKAQSTSSPEKIELIGLSALVSEKIQKEGFGQISYVVNGNSFTAPARSTHNEELAAGTQVSICWIREHVFYVAPLKEENESVENEAEKKA